MSDSNDILDIETMADRDALMPVSSGRTAASLSSKGIDARFVAECAAHAVSDKQCDDIVVLDLTELSDV